MKKEDKEPCRKFHTKEQRKKNLGKGRKPSVREEMEVFERGGGRLYKRAGLKPEEGNRRMGDSCRRGKGGQAPGEEKVGGDCKNQTGVLSACFCCRRERSQWEKGGGMGGKKKNKMGGGKQRGGKQKNQVPGLSINKLHEEGKARGTDERKTKSRGDQGDKEGF